LSGSEYAPPSGSARLWKDRNWSEYPIGTKAHAYNGGHWTKMPNGWKWFCGDTFATPGGDAIGACIELPNNARLETERRSEADER
jgi:hypothetical protein